MADGIDKDQLRLLMDNYKEQIQLNTKLLERQARFFDSLDRSTHDLIEAINAQTVGLQSVLSVGIAGLGEKMTEEHGDINLRIYVALGGMLSLLVTLVTLWVMA